MLLSFFVILLYIPDKLFNINFKFKFYFTSQIHTHNFFFLLFFFGEAFSQLNFLFISVIFFKHKIYSILFIYYFPRIQHETNNEIKLIGYFILFIFEFFFFYYFYFFFIIFL